MADELKPSDDTMPAKQRRSDKRAKSVKKQKNDAPAPKSKRSARHSKNSKKPLSKNKRIVIIVLCSVAFVITCAVGFGIWRFVDTMKTINEGMGGGGIGIGDIFSGVFGGNQPSVTHLPVIYEDEVEPIVLDENIYNILVLGLDTRNPRELTGSRSDVMMIVTLDAKNNALKMTSILRDVLVSIPGHDKNRINTANVFGGADLAREVVESTFGVDIHWTVCLNFWTVAKIIDSMGGVEIDIKQDEVHTLNDALTEINRYSLDGRSPNITGTGLQLLDGRQAVAYMRIRYTAGGDFARTERQRTVMEKMFKQATALQLVDMLGLATETAEYMRTDMSSGDILLVARSMYNLKSAPLRQMRLPMDDTYYLDTYKNMSVIMIDFAANNKAFAEFLQN